LQDLLGQSSKHQMRDHTDDRGEQRIGCEMPRPLKRVREGVLHRGELVAVFFRADRRPHQRPAETESDQQDRNRQCREQHQDPKQTCDQNADIQTEQQSRKQTGYCQRYHADQGKQRCDQVAPTTSPCERQRLAHPDLLFASEGHDTDAGDGPAQQRPDGKRPE